MTIHIEKLLKERGALPAIEIRQRLRLTHEEVYIDLVRMYSAGKVSVRIARGDRTGNTWSLK